jgi:hypothetical protein
MQYLSRLLRGNIRLISLAIIASVGFFFTEFWRNVIQDQIEDIDRLMQVSSETVKKISTGDMQRDLMRFTLQPQAGIETVNRASNLTREALSTEFVDVANDQLAAREHLRRITDVFLNDADLRSIEFASLATTIGTSSIRPRHMQPVEVPAPAYQDSFVDACHTAYWPEAPQVVKDALAAMKPVQPPKDPANLAEQFIYVANDGQRIYNGIMSLSNAINVAVNSFGAGGGEGKDPRPFMAEQASAALRASLLYGGCIDLIVRSHTSQLVVLLRNYQMALMDARKPIAEQRDWLRYVAYLIAIIAFFASNLKPAAPVKPADGSVEANRFAEPGSEKGPVPHDAVAANDGSNRPTGDGNAVIGRPPHA